MESTQEDFHDVPSSFGFRTFRPTPRAERRATRDKATLERNRIMQRVGWQARLHQKYMPDTQAGLTSLSPDAAGYLADADRFHTDVSGDEKKRRDHALRRREQATQFRREQALEREEARWKKLSDDRQTEEEYWTRQREIGARDRKNKSAVPYDVITTQYNDSLEGEACRFADDIVRYRAQLRTHNIVKRGGSRVSYNIISGEATEFPSTAILPDKPALSEQYTQKLEMRTQQLATHGVDLDRASQSGIVSLPHPSHR